MSKLSEKTGMSVTIIGMIISVIFACVTIAIGYASTANSKSDDVIDRVSTFEHRVTSLETKQELQYKEVKESLQRIEQKQERLLNTIINK